MELAIACACTGISGTASFPTSESLPVEFCHCSTCRHSTGQLALSSFDGPTSSPLKITGNLIAYKAAERLTRYHCGECGASIYIHDEETGHNFVISGVANLKGLRAQEFTQHIFVSDTKDGGCNVWLEGPTWREFPERSERWEQPKQPLTTTHESETLKCYCQCRGVQFLITRPNPDSAKTSSPISDLLQPYHSTPSQPTTPSTWWLRANNTKYLAGTCACNSCRLSSGFDIQSWAFIPKTNIRKLDGSEIDYGMGTLKRYSHSKGKYREFCSRCGATVFWHCDERPGVVDVSVGLMDAEEGVRAEGWLEWLTERVSFEEDAMNKRLIGCLKKGLKKWGEKKTS